MNYDEVLGEQDIDLSMFSKEFAVELDYRNDEIKKVYVNFYKVHQLIMEEQKLTREKKDVLLMWIERIQYECRKMRQIVKKEKCTEAL